VRINPSISRTEKNDHATEKENLRDVMTKI